MFITVHAINLMISELFEHGYELHQEIRFEESMMGGSYGDDYSWIEDAWNTLDDLTQRWDFLISLTDGHDFHSEELVLVPC